MTLMPKKPDRSERSGAVSLRDEVNRLFDDFVGGMLAQTPRGEWLPALDVSETDTQIIVKAEVPGIKADDIDISLMGDTLTIKGEKKEESREERENYHRVERRYGAFQRTLSLPSQVDPDKVKASYKDGVLKVSMEKREESRARSIKVKVE